MHSVKLIVTHRGNLLEKYGDDGVAAIDRAVAELIAADEQRGLKTVYVHLDDAEEVTRYHSRVSSKHPSAKSCKKIIDKLCKFA